MRISVDKDDPGFANNLRAALITLDGFEIKDCITVDEEFGEAICYERDEQGKLVLEGEGNDRRFKIITKRGTVKIHLPADWTRA